MTTSSFIAIVSLALLLGSVNAQLSTNFYSSSWPNLFSTVKSTVQSAISKEARMGASILRLFFHDCFVNHRKRVVELHVTGKRRERVIGASRRIRNLNGQLQNRNRRQNVKGHRQVHTRLAFSSTEAPLERLRSSERIVESLVRSLAGGDSVESEFEEKRAEIQVVESRFGVRVIGGRFSRREFGSRRRRGRRSSRKRRGGFGVRNRVYGFGSPLGRSFGDGDSER
ncbi:peroxidase 4 [Quercus suber]|uniref:peroxidase n=1 Tax=Quercus suber TaxID=58331 RepID=A0AAW0KCH4_QUESU